MSISKRAGWTKRARVAARRAQRMARTGAIRIQRASGELADRLRKRGRQAAGKDITVMEMARLDKGRASKLLQRSVEATLHRERGPLPDPAWTAGYRDVAAARVPGFGWQPAAAAVPAGSDPPAPRRPRPSWPLIDPADPDREAGE